jgi:hypothetical protein
MSDTKHIAEPRLVEALVDIRTLTPLCPAER